MMHLTLNYDILYALTKSIRAIEYDAIVRVAHDGLHCCVSDPSNASSVSVDIPREAFTQYEIDKEYAFGVDMYRLLEAIGDGTEGEEIPMWLNPKEGHKLHLKVGGFEYELAIMDPSALRRPPKIPKLEYSGSVDIHGSTFKTLLKSASKVSNYITIMLRGSTLSMHADGQIDSVEMIVPEDDVLASAAVEPMHGVSSKYTLSFLSEIAQAISARDSIRLQLGNDYPISIIHRGIEAGSIEYMVAPRVEAV